MDRTFSVADVEPRPLRVLVIEDEPLLRWAIAETLGRAGHVVVDAGDAASALRTLREPGPIDVVLMDCGLPDSTGAELLAQLRRLSPRSAIVMMTGHPTPEVVAAAVAHGVEQFLVKPFDMTTIEEELRNACDRHAPHAGDLPPAG